ncbi:sugar kinase [Clostridiaceae bacterium AF42-6]|nr:sugar kinase [Clostridiaceae bacterium AF42-6]RHP48852.1 sugar kinase [Clostridiaceae bacterium AF31-3BH]
MEKGAILVGEPMGLFIAQEEGKLSDVSGYSMAVAGAEFNVAVGLARLNLPVTYLTRLGEDPFGQKIVRTLQRNGIGSEFVSFSKERSTGFMLKSKVSTGDPKIFYFRKGSAASTLSKEDVDRMDFSGYGFVHLTGIFPALSESTKEASFYLIKKAREHGLTVSFDPNLRPQLWPDTETMVQTLNEFAALSDYVLPGEAEGELLCGDRDPRKIGQFYLERGAKAVVTKMGSRGAYLMTEQDQELVPGFSIEKVVDTVGAGDGFAAGILSALMEGKNLYEAVRRANAVGAIQVTSIGDNDGLPSRAQLAGFMGLETL